MKQVIVDIVHLKVPHRVVVHLHTRIEIGVREVRHLGGDEIFVARMTFQGDAGGSLRPALHVHGSRIEVVHTMPDGVVHQTVHLLLVDHIPVFRRRRKHGPTHTSVSQYRHPVGRRRYGAVSHLALRHFDGTSVRGPVLFSRRASVESGGGRRRTYPHDLQEIAAVHLIVCMSVVLVHIRLENLKD